MSVGLALVMTLICLPVGGLKVEAASCAVNDAVSWITDKAETGWNTDVDGEWGCQCVDLIFAYYLFLGYPSQGGNAFQYAQGSFGIPAGSGWYKDTTPSPGAIIVWPGNTDTGSWTTGENGHVGLVYSVIGSAVYTVESNVDNGGSIYGGPARYRTRYPKNAVYIHPVFSDSPGVPSVDYSPITPGNYFIISQSDGKSLTLANNEDWNTNNVHMYETAWSNRGQHMEISQASDGYKIRPIDSTRLVNPYGDYAAEGQNINIYADVNDSSQWWKFEKSGDGYIIRNAQNPNLVIDNADSSEAKLWTFNNGSNQKWLLVPAAAPGAPAVKGVKSSYTQSEAIIADWDATYNTDRYDIGVAKYENGDYKWVFWQGNVTPEFNVSAAAELGAGEYRMRLESVNTKIPLGNGSAYLSTVGEYVYFDIKENAAAPESYTIAFNANGGSGTMPNVSMTVGVAKNLPANKFTRTGYTFLGWSTNKSAASPTYKDKQSVKDLAQSGTVTLYAIWKKNASSNVNNCEFRVDNVTAALGKTVKIPIYIDNAKVMSAELDVKFDPSVLKYKSYSDEAFDFVQENTNNTSKGELTLVGVNTSGLVNGKILVLNFEVIAKKDCSTKINVSSSDASDGEKEISIKSAEATVTVSSAVLGDVTGEGKVSTQDVIWILQSIVKKRTLNDAQKIAADVTKDGKISTQDVIWILQYIVGKRKL